MLEYIVIFAQCSFALQESCRTDYHNVNVGYSFIFIFRLVNLDKQQIQDNILNKSSGQLDEIIQ